MLDRAAEAVASAGDRLIAQAKGYLVLPGAPPRSPAQAADPKRVMVPLGSSVTPGSGRLDPEEIAASAGARSPHAATGSRVPGDRQQDGRSSPAAAEDLVRKPSARRVRERGEPAVCSAVIAALGGNAHRLGRVVVLHLAPSAARPSASRRWISQGAVSRTACASPCDRPQRFDPLRGRAGARRTRAPRLGRLAMQRFTSGLDTATKCQGCWSRRPAQCPRPRARTRTGIATQSRSLFQASGENTWIPRSQSAPCTSSASSSGSAAWHSSRPCCCRPCAAEDARGSASPSSRPSRAAFAWQARGTTLLVGATGFHLTAAWDLWDRFSIAGYWVDARHGRRLGDLHGDAVRRRAAVLHRRFLERARRDPEGTFRRIERMHWVLLTLSLVTILGAVAGAHGWRLSLGWRTDAPSSAFQAASTRQATVPLRGAPSSNDSTGTHSTPRLRRRRAVQPLVGREHALREIACEVCRKSAAAATRRSSYGAGVPVPASTKITARDRRDRARSRPAAGTR